MFMSRFGDAPGDTRAGATRCMLVYFTIPVLAVLYCTEVLRVACKFGVRGLVVEIEILNKAQNQIHEQDRKN